MLGMVGAADRIRLERHFDEIRDLEMRIAAMPPITAAACQLPPDPGADPPVGGDNAGTGSDTIGTNTGYSDEHERARRAGRPDPHGVRLRPDARRHAADHGLPVAHERASRSRPTWALPVRADLHEVGHNGDAENRGQLPVSLCLQWHISHYAYLLDKLKNTPEGAGTVLDNSAIVFMPEAGHGTQLNDAHVRQRRTRSRTWCCSSPAAPAGCSRAGTSPPPARTRARV